MVNEMRQEGRGSIALGRENATDKFYLAATHLVGGCPGGMSSLNANGGV